jgi:alkylhydroperoxidase/carboxymuconolactone decarboxylase family protein YurZ
MNRLITEFLAIILAMMFIIAAISEAQSMDKNQALSAKQQGIITIAAFTAKGDLEKLKVSLNEGLDAGLTVNEIKEILVQLYAYTGFPRSLNGLDTFMSILEERHRKGIKDEAGREASPFPANKSSIEVGTEIQTRLVGKPVSGEVYTFAPAIDQFLKGHLFGDIFGRDNLDFQSREIATISALTSMDGVDPQLQAHLNVSMNVGLSEAQLRQFVSVLGNKVGKNESAKAARLLAEVLINRKASSGKQPKT